MQEYEDDFEDEFFDDYDDDDDDDFELGGWAVVHDSGDLIQDGFDTEEDAEDWLAENAAFLEDDISSYHITEVED